MQVVCVPPWKGGEGAGERSQQKQEQMEHMVKKQFAVICCFGNHATMEQTCSQEMLRIFQRQNVFSPYQPVVTQT